MDTKELCTLCCGTGIHYPDHSLSSLFGLSEEEGIAILCPSCGGKGYISAKRNVCSETETFYNVTCPCGGDKNCPSCGGTSMLHIKKFPREGLIQLNSCKWVLREPPLPGIDADVLMTSYRGFYSANDPKKITWGVTHIASPTPSTTVATPATTPGTTVSTPATTPDTAPGATQPPNGFGKFLSELFG